MKNILVIAAMLIGLAGISFAQTGPTASDNVTVSTDIVAALTCTKTADLNLGTAVQGNTKTVAVTDANAGKFTVTGTASATASVIFTFAAPATLSDGGSNTIAFTPATPVYNSTNNAGTATAFGAVTGGNILLPAGTVYIFIGGSVSPSGSQAAGHYTGTYTLTVQYQ